MSSKPALLPDWDSEILRRAAVEYALSVLPAPTAANRAKPAFIAALDTLATQLAAPSPRELLDWVLDPALHPAAGAYRRDVSHAPQEHQSQADFLDNHVKRQTLEFDTSIAYKTDEIDSFKPDPLAAPVATDPLALLLQQEDTVLSCEERTELADAIESGAPLDQRERLALACLLRGSELASRREIVRAVLDWVAPSVEGVTEIWELRETILTVPLGSAYHYQPLAHPLLSRGDIGRCRLIISAPSGEVLHARPFHRVKGSDVTSRSLQLRVKYLRPVKRFARDHTLHQFALLASLVREEERDGKEWGALFGVKSGKALVSYHKKKLVERIQSDTQSTTGFRAVRNTPDPRKGTTLKPKSAP